MKTVFIIHNPAWASARLRAAWPAKYMEDARVMLQDDFIRERPRAENYIFIKQALPDLFGELRTRSKCKLFLDWCDPGWWGSPDAVREIASLVDGIVTSNEPLSDDLRGEIGYSTPVYTIPDRIEPSCYLMRRTHQEVNPVQFIWFGAGQNRVSLFSWAYLDKLAGHGCNISLTICDDQPEQIWSHENFPIYHVRWSEHHENEIYTAHDIAFLPPYPGPWGRVKSNNKAVTATLCGLPVTDGNDWGHICRLAESAEYRTQTVAKQIVMYQEFMQPWKSAAEWEALLA